jgi:PAS domain S-box-containing protein
MTSVLNIEFYTKREWKKRSNQGAGMRYKFSEIIDVPKLKNLLEGFYAVSNILTAVLDTDANILIAVGWQDICTKFHRINDQAEMLCKQSDLYIKKYLGNHQRNTEANICYRCANGLIDVAAPIIIEGVHLATIYTGQFLFEEPDIEQFRQQARKYSFDEKEYLDALKKVPVYTKEKVELIMNFIRQIAEMLVQMGLAKLQLIESQEKALQMKEEKLRSIINNTPNLAIHSYDENGIIQFSNKTSEIIFGWVKDEAIGKTIDQLVFDCITAHKFSELFQIAKGTGKPIETTEWTFLNNKGSEKSILVTLFPVNVSDGKREFICLSLDITEKKRLEKEMHRLEQLNLIGQLAAGIGHEVRNPMTTVRGLLQLYGNKVQQQKDKEYFELMIQEIDRANSIITEFLSLAKNKRVCLEQPQFGDYFIEPSYRVGYAGI